MVFSGVCVQMSGPTQEDEKALEDWVKVKPITPEQKLFLADIRGKLPALETFFCTRKPFPSKRLQATFGRECILAEYPFSGIKNPIKPASEPMRELMEEYAKAVGVPIECVMAHVNIYPAGTAAGCGAHQDLEHVDQTKDIWGFQWGGAADLCVWQGDPKEAAKRAGAKLRVTADDVYIFQAGMQEVASHAVKRKKSDDERGNITLRVCKIEPPRKRARIA